MATCDAREVMAVSACWTCLDARQMMSAILQVLCEINQNQNPMATCDVNDLMSKASCFNCLSGNQPMLVMLQLLCEILQSGGGGTDVCNFCEEFPPNQNPPAGCTCGHWTDTLQSEMWYWRPLTATWVKYISNT